MWLSMMKEQISQKKFCNFEPGKYLIGHTQTTDLIRIKRVKNGEK